MSPSVVSTSRRYDFDWLRVLLILTVFVFHSLRFFDIEYWHIKNATTYYGIQILIIFLSRWMMPAIFLVSGAATFFSLGKRGATVFLRDRALRLVVPLVVGLFTHVILQGYLEEVHHNHTSASFWDFYASRFNGLAGLGGNFNWVGNHLWYLVILIFLTLMCLPLFIWLRRGSGQRALAWLGDRLSAPGMVYLMALPTLLVLWFVNPDLSWVLTGDSWGGWSTINHLIFFVSGFLLASSMGMQSSIRKLRWVSLIAMAVSFAVGGAFLLTQGEPDFGEGAYWYLLNIINVIVAWGGIFAIFGFGLERLNFRTPALDYANEAVMPFYVLHQSVLIVIGFFVVRWAVPDLLKWLIIMPSSFAIIMAIYELLVRRVNALRVLFGMKPIHREKLVQRTAVPVS